MDVTIVLLSVGYDSEHLMLDGKFHYERENQRTLPFNVDIRPLPEERRLVVGSSSKFSAVYFVVSGI